MRQVITPLILLVLLTIGNILLGIYAFHKWYVIPSIYVFGGIITIFITIITNGLPYKRNK